MKCWSTAGVTERRQFEAISVCLSQSRHLLRFLFDPNQPRLRASPERLLVEARGLCSGDYLLIKVALEIWSCGGFVSLHELFEAEPEIFTLILQAMTMLAPRPDAWPRALIEKTAAGDILSE